VSDIASQRYIGRFAPSPTGPLHFGSLVAALASYVDARAREGQWLVRIEDVDTQRCSREHEATILAQLEAYGFEHDAAIVRQSDRSELYRAALQSLADCGLTYRCICTRKQLASAPRNSEGETIYPGTCRDANFDANVDAKAPAFAVRLNLARTCVATFVEFVDRVYGHIAQPVHEAVGDFVLHRADGDFAYQLAVVVDDAIQGVTHVVRGADLLLNTPRQILLQRALGYATPSYLHLPLAFNAQGEKLSKQTLAPSLPNEPEAKLANLRRAWRHLDQIDIEYATSPNDFLRQAVAIWQPQRLQARKIEAETQNL
jgi:glutamyl-Q tRNA(Asp) synthetase